MSGIYDHQEIDFAAALAAGTFAVCSLEEAKANYMREMSKNHKRPTTEIRSAKEDSSVAVTKASSIKDAPVKNASLKPPPAATASRKPSQLASMKPSASANQLQRRNSVRSSNAMEDKVDSWEKAQLRKINKRYDKMRAEVVVWENKKKTQAKLSMERKKKELEMRKIRNAQHYQIKVDRIEAIAGGAKGQLEEKRRREEAEVKEKVKNMRTKGKNPVSCFCC